MRIDFTRLGKNGYYGIAIAAGLICACFILMYYLFHNPYKDLHERIFNIAGKVNNYYREKPSYWKLSTISAAEDNLIGDIREKYAEYDFSIGQGAGGEISLPSDASFDIALKNLSKSACIALSEYPLEEQQRLYLLKITIVNEKQITEFSWGQESKLPVEKYAARNICSASGNTLIWTFQ